MAQCAARISVLGIMVMIVYLLLLAIPVLIGVYVYRDAKRRGMNAVLWVLIAIFAPSLIGLIIYLLVRNNYSDLKCPRCDTPVREQYVVCPKCGVKLKASCPNCGEPVEAGWKLCPKCAGSLPTQYENVEKPRRAEDKSLKKILIVIIIVPIILILLLIFSNVAFSFIRDSGTSMEEISMQEEYEIGDWI